MTYTPPPPMTQPAQPAGRDNTTLFGWIGIIGGLCCGILGLIFGALSIVQAKKWGQSPVLGYIGIVIGVLNIIGGIVYQVRR
jgi:predicted lipid-binding transport protein (Tim44 family)